MGKSKDRSKISKKQFAELFFISPEHLAAQTGLDNEVINETLFVLPHNDGESARCCQILRALKAPHIHVSKQKWGATLDREWNNLHPETYDPEQIKTILIFELPGIAPAMGDVIASEARLNQMGFEVKIIDHHYYHWVDRFNPLSSLEQFCQYIGWQMNQDDLAIAINDRSYIPGLKKRGWPLDYIRKVRLYDLLAQGNNNNYIERQLQIARDWIPILRTKRRGELWVLADPTIKQPYVVQELSLQVDDGLVHTFEIKPHRLGFSGRTEIVDWLLTQDFSKWHHAAGGLITYAGGDGIDSKYWGAKTKSEGKALPAGMAEEVLDMILQELSGIEIATK